MRGQLAELWKHQSRSANEAKFTAADLDRKLVTKERELAKLRERCEKVRASHRMAQAQLQQVSRVCPSQCDAMACKPIQCAMHCCAVLCCAVRHCQGIDCDYKVAQYTARRWRSIPTGLTRQRAKPVHTRAACDSMQTQKQKDEWRRLAEQEQMQTQLLKVENAELHATIKEVLATSRMAESSQHVSTQASIACFALLRCECRNWRIVIMRPELA
jgi:multidrug resistance efflux pump